MLVLLDLSAAFDTVDHSILLHRLEHWVGLSGTVLGWLKSYLEGRQFYVSIGNWSSPPTPLHCGVPQGSILGPLLFNLYMLPLGLVIRQRRISYHSYADDTQLYFSLSPNDLSPLDTLICCVEDVKNWMSTNFLQLNNEKTEIIVFGKKDLRDRISSKLTCSGYLVKTTVKNLGVQLDSELSFNSHIKAITKSSYYHLKHISKYKNFMSQDDLEKLIHAFVSSRLDYCNGLLTGLPKKTIRQLQLIQNAAARILMRAKRTDHITPLLKHLHWLPVQFRIDFKILLLVFKSLNGTGPVYLKYLLQHYTPTRSLRSQERVLLIPPITRTKQGEAAFSSYAVKVWNCLPEYTKTAPTTSCFKSRLKTHLFSLAYA